MKEIRIIMGMPVTLEIIDESAGATVFEKVFSYFNSVDQKFSTYKKDSEITAINEGKISPDNYSKEMQEIFSLAEETKNITNGYFDIYNNDKCDPSGIVKGWAIYNAAQILKKDGFKNFYVEVAGDIEVSGLNNEGKKWAIGIRNPFKQEEIVKVVHLGNKGIATSGTYVQGEHIYNPKKFAEVGLPQDIINDTVSLTVIGPNVYEADRFATAAFAMSKKGIEFIEKLDGFEGYIINKDGIATMTTGFEKYTIDEYA
jgi:thiamine biosynthesis lipoprotein